MIRQRQIWIFRQSTNHLTTINGSESENEPAENVAEEGKRKRIKNLNSKSVLLEGDEIFIHHDFQPPKKEIEDFVYSPNLLPDKEEQKELESLLLYKDDDLLILNKPNHLSVQGGHKSQKSISKLLEMLKFEKEERPHLVHRLDKLTSGVLLLARHRPAARKLSEMFRNASDPSKFQHKPIEHLPKFDIFGRPLPTIETEKESENSLSIEKHYWAILTNFPKNNKGIIDRHLYIHPDTGIDLSSEEILQKEFSEKVQIRHPNQTSPYDHPYLKRAITEYKVLKEIGHRGCWVDIKPQTGRKHQLRVHCAQALASPILGDFKYGISSYKKLHEIGWGQLLDFSRYTGWKSVSDGMPMFLHLRYLKISNYYEYFGKEKNNKEKDLKIYAPLPPVWKQLFEQCQIPYSHIKYE